MSEILKGIKNMFNPSIQLIYISCATPSKLWRQIKYLRRDTLGATVFGSKLAWLTFPISICLAACNSAILWLIKNNINMKKLSFSPSSSFCVNVQGLQIFLPWFLQQRGARWKWALCTLVLMQSQSSHLIYIGSCEHMFCDTG